MSQSEGPRLQSVERVDLSEWQVQTLRFTAFPHSPTLVDPSGWWERVFRGAPDVRISEPQKRIHREEGSFGGGTLTLRVTPGRIDWLLHRTDPDFDDFPIIASLPESLEGFCELMSRWLGTEDCPVLTRIAFGAVLLYPVPDHRAGYVQLQSYLHRVDLDPSSSDFLYQINRRRKSDRLPGLNINRLSKWSVTTFAPMGFFAGPATGIVSVPEVPHYACRLELDINTVPGEEEELDREQLQPIFRDLVSLGQEVVREGDIP